MFDLCKTAVQKNKSGYIRIEEVDLEERTKTMNCGENYECLLQIFQYLPIADKIRFERGNILNVIKNCRNRLVQKKKVLTKPKQHAMMQQHCMTKLVKIANTA